MSIIYCYSGILIPRLDPFGPNRSMRVLIEGLDASEVKKIKDRSIKGLKKVLRKGESLTEHC